jgi:hypothetical protein
MRSGVDIVDRACFPVDLENGVPHRTVPGARPTSCRPYRLNPAIVTAVSAFERLSGFAMPENAGNPGFSCARIEHGRRTVL